MVHRPDGPRNNWLGRAKSRESWAKSQSKIDTGVEPAAIADGAGAGRPLTAAELADDWPGALARLDWVAVEAPAPELLPMVPCPWASTKLALTGLDKLTQK